MQRKPRSAEDKVAPIGLSSSYSTTNLNVTRDARYADKVAAIAQNLPVWREERLPPPRVSQSQYDKVGLTGKLLVGSAAPS